MITNMSRNSGQTLLNFTNDNVSSLEYIFEVSDLRESSRNLVFMIIIFGVGVSFRVTCNTLGRRFLYYPMMLLMGFISGVIIYYRKEADLYNFSIVAKFNPNNFLLIFFPVMLFHTAFSMDYHGFGHSTLQVLFISIIGFPIQVTLLTLLFSPLVKLIESWTWEVAITFSIICYIIESDIVLYELNKTQERVKHIQLLLQGEQLATLATATFSFRVNFEYYYGTSDKLTFFVLTLLWHLLGIVFGVVFGYVISYVFINAANEIPVAVTLTMFAAFFSFYVAHLHIYQAGVVATIMTGVMLSPTNLKTTADIEAQLTIYWDWISFVFNTTAFVIPGVIVGLNPVFVSFKLIFDVIIIYIFCCCTRLIFFIAAKPLLLKMGHNLSKKNIAIVVIGPYRAAPALIIAMLYRKYSPDDGQQVLTYTATLCFLSTLVNGYLIPYLLNLLGMYDLTHARALNMKNAIENIQKIRIKSILALKMDRISVDANWIVVEESTKLTDVELESLSKKDRGSTKKVTESLKATFAETKEERGSPTRKELKDLEIEAKHRILKAQLVSMWRQYETGTLSKSSMRIVSTLLQNSMEKSDPRLDVNDLELYWSPPKSIKKIKVFLQYILKSFPPPYNNAYQSRVQAVLLKVFNSLQYKMVSTFLIALDTFLGMRLGTHFRWTSITSLSPTIMQSFDFFFYSIFMIEFVMLIFALGCFQYFSPWFLKIDFLCNVLIRTSKVLMVISHIGMTGKFTGYSAKDTYVLCSIDYMLILRLNRLYTVTEVIILKILHLIENRLDNTLVQYYEIGKAFLIANDRTLKHLRHIVQDKEIYHSLRKLLEEDRRKVAKSIGIMQKERPNVGVTTKTVHAVIQVINEMNDCINDIYDEGLLDDIEKKYLKSSIERARRHVRNLKGITPGSPEYILKEVPWLFEENETATFLLEHAKLVRYSYQDVMIEVDDEPFGLFVLVSGLVKWVYKPSLATVEVYKKYGALPNCDFLNSLKYEEPQEDYIICGNVIGEIGAVTGRRFDMTVICESEVQVYYIPRLCMYKVLFEMENCSVVFCKVWKTIGIRIALIILQYVPQFQGWQREKTLLYLEKSFVPMLTGVEELYINEMVADVILIEGRIMDGSSRSVYYAPFYIPRTVFRLILPGTNKWKEDPVFAPRLLIIPHKHIEENDILGPEGIMKEGKEPFGKELHAAESSIILGEMHHLRNNF